MRWFIFLYLSIVLIFSTAVQTPYMPPEGVGYSSTEKFNSSLQELSQSLSENKGTISAFTDLIKGTTSIYIKTIIAMSTFQFKITSAPDEVRDFITAFFGLLSLMFIVAVLREVMKIVPFVGS